MGKMNGFCREINFNGYYNIGWRKEDKCHGYNKHVSPQEDANEEGLYEYGEYKD